MWPLDIHSLERRLDRRSPSDAAPAGESGTGRRSGNAASAGSTAPRPAPAPPCSGPRSSPHACRRVGMVRPGTSTPSPRSLAIHASRSVTLNAMWSCNCPRGLTSGVSPWFAYQVSTTSPNSTPARGVRNIPSRFSAGQVRSAPRGTLQSASVSGTSAKPARAGAFRCFWYQSYAHNGSSCQRCTWLKRSAG